jgi:hypothetical protein
MCFRNFFSYARDSYGILDPNLLAKIILLWSRRFPKEVVNNIEEFNISSEECRFKIALELIQTQYAIGNYKILKIDLEKFDLSVEHKEENHEYNATLFREIFEELSAKEGVKVIDYHTNKVECLR